MTRKASLNAATSVIDYGARLLIGLVITPLIVNGLGNYFYGLWQVLNRIVGYALPSSHSPVSALKYSLAHHQASEDYQQKRQYVGSAFTAWLLLLPFIGAFGGIIIWFAPYWLDTSAEYVPTVRWVSALLLLNLVGTSLSAIPHSILAGENLAYKRLGWSAVLILFGGFLTWLALKLDTGIIGISVATVVSVFLTGLFYLFIARSSIHWFGYAKPPLHEARHFLGLTGWFMGWAVINNIMVGSDVVLLGILTSVEAVTVYSLTRYTGEILINVVAILITAIIPGLGRIIGNAEYQKAAQLRGEIMAMTWLIITFTGSTLLIWNQAFLQLWVGGSQYAGTFINVLILLMVVQYVLFHIDGYVIDLTLNIKHKVLIGAFSVIASIGFSVIAVKFYNAGAAGLLIGFILGRSIITILFPVIVSQRLKLSILSQLKHLFRPALVTAIFFFVSAQCDDLAANLMGEGIQGWIGFIGMAGFTAVFFLVVSFLLGLNRQQRATIRLRLRLLLPERSR